jgi:ABC-2 type transport system permease protein
MKGFWAIFKARNVEFWRDKGNLSWNFIFPLMLIAGFTLIFSGEGQPKFKVGYLAKLDAYATQPQLFDLRHIKLVHYEQRSQAMSKLRTHKIDLLMDLDERRYWVNRDAPNGYFLERLLLSNDDEYQRSLIEGRTIRYIDWVLPGIIGMTIMFNSLFGVGYTIVRYRKNGVLKRLQATPLSALSFLSAHVLSRLIIVLSVASILFFGSFWVLDIVMVGSWWLLLLVVLLGSMSMISLGLLIASRMRSEEFTGSLLNFISWPMMILSGVWFSLEGAPRWLIEFSQMLPLTHLVDAAPETTTSNASFFDILPSLTVLSAMTLIFLGVAGTLFSWTSDHR